MEILKRTVYEERGDKNMKEEINKCKTQIRKKKGNE